MVMNHMIQFMKQISGRFISNDYTSLSDPHQIAYLRNLQREIKKNDVLNIPFDDLQVVVFDIETTGFYPYKGDRILTIGAVKMVGDQIFEDDTFYSAIYSEEGPSEKIEKLTGITKEQLMKAPPLQEVLRQFYQFAKSDTLVAHHSNHEKQFMKRANWEALKTNFQHRILDTTFLMKPIGPELNLTSLDEYCDYFGIYNEQRHHALYDAIATANIWSEGIRSVKQLGYSNLNDLYSYLANEL
ncbi:exonuclease domain-containing protein [Salirhabdus salicampi]|uniref:exonuclease domain-containing protein n=1 Tax=Salirhabdus salicampi TaxID=476102 RepID=UPI0020C278F4|nr:exonuclease domain-containing protein [Salirhabdus salicampi]MCP8617256.1 exonuclease domain-containing protein [Salirhabdus salicampi]